MKRILFVTSLIAIFVFFYSCNKKEDIKEMGSLYGIVSDKATGEPIQNANVVLQPTGVSIKTGDDGIFEFSNVEANTYNLYVTKSGYLDFKTTDIHVNAASKDKPVSIQLEKLPPALHVMDGAGLDIDTINFGAAEGDIMRSFNIFNKSDESLEWEIAHSAVWIKSFSKEKGVLKAGATQSIVLTIDRSKIISGEVSTIAHIVSDNGSKELTIIASASAVVETTDVSDIQATSAILSANVLQNMEPSIVEYGFVYNKEAMPTLDNGAYKVFRIGIPQLGKYSILIDSLIPETKYHACAYVSNGAKVVYGSQVDFTTIAHHPSVNVQKTDVTASTFTIEYDVHDGGAKIEEVGICWDTKSFPTKESNYQNTGHEAKQYTSIITGLSTSTTYYVRVYVRNIEEEVYSTEMVITTLDGLPIVETSNEYSSTASTITVGGNITSNGGYIITDRGVCYSTTNAQPTLTDGNVSSGKGNGEYQVSITDLLANTNYYVRAYATNENGTTYGETVLIQTLSGLASVSLSYFTNVSALAATGVVVVNNTGGATLQSCGICWATTPNPTTADQMVVASGKALQTAYNCGMSNLSPSTIYYVRAYAITDVATSYSSQKTFSTTSGLPELTTTPPTSTSINITSGGNITNDGGYTITARGLCYSMSNSEPTLNDAYTISGTGIGAFNSIITSVLVSTTYYVRAYATNSIGTGYGNVFTVTTGDGLPSVITTTVGDNVTETTAIGGGNVTEDGGYIVTARGVCWSSLPYPTINDNITSNGSGLGYYSSNITGLDLTGNNVYYVRAYATNINGTTYGQQVIINKENIDYKNLPTFEYGGYTYRLYQDIGAMNWEDANTASENLVYGGYDDWFLPSKEELQLIMTSYKKGWYNEDGTKWVYYSRQEAVSTRSYVTPSAGYWTSSPVAGSSGYYYYLYFTTDSYYSSGQGTTYRNWYYHVTSPESNSNATGVTYRVRPVRKYIAN